jgi:hypothetical protein
VVRTIVTAISGNIKGSYVDRLAVVTATPVDATVYSSSVNEFGQFQISGLLPGYFYYNFIAIFPI